jgi:hypothetical protein
MVLLSKNVLKFLVPYQEAQRGMQTLNKSRKKLRHHQQRMTSCIDRRLIQPINHVSLLQNIEVSKIALKLN